MAILIEDCKSFVDSNLPALIKELILESWEIEVDCHARLDGNNIAECDSDPDYMFAIIRIDCDKIKSEKHLKSVLYHELCHVIQAPIEFYRGLMKSSDSELDQKLWTHAVENVVTHLERIFMARQGEHV
jgi:hypothetical protein